MKQQPTRKQIHASMAFQSASLPCQPGDQVHMGDKPELYEVVSFNGNTYTLRTPAGVELKAGRFAVRREIAQ